MEGSCRPYDIRNKLDRLYVSEYLEEQGPPGPKCFGPRIMNEQPPSSGFQMPRGSKSYDGSTKPEDWLTDYVIRSAHGTGKSPLGSAVYTADVGGSGQDLAEQSARGQHQLLARLSKKRLSATSPAHTRGRIALSSWPCAGRWRMKLIVSILTRWSKVRNSCEGVVEAQAISWFAQGCRHGSMLWQRLQREMPGNFGRDNQDRRPVRTGRPDCSPR